MCSCGFARGFSRKTAAPIWPASAISAKLLSHSAQGATMKIKTLTMAIPILLGAGILMNAQQAGFSRTILQQVEASIPGRELVTAVAEFERGASVGPHTHPGDE